MLTAFLLPFQTATSVTQADTATLYDVWEQFSMLLTHICNSRSSFVGAVVDRAAAALRLRWNNQTNQAATIACAVLSMGRGTGDVAAAVLEQANQFIVSFGASYLQFYKLSPLPLDALRGELGDQLGSFLGRRDRFEHLGEQLREAKARRPDGAFNPLNIWDRYACELAVVAKALLCITASEAAVERSFSAQDSLHTKKRNKLLDNTVQLEMFVKFNSRALNREQHYQLRVSTSELPADADLFIEGEMAEEDGSETESDGGSQDEAKQSDPPAAADSAAASAAASSAAPVRSASELDASMRSFLTSYIDTHGITLANCRRWNNDRCNALDDALVKHFGRGSYTTKTCIELIKSILAEQNAGAS